MQHIMPSRVFNTHAAGKRLQDAGTDDRLAEAVVATLGAAVSEHVATKTDIPTLTADLSLASLIDEAVEPFTALVDWWQKDDLQRQMRSRIKRQLRASGIVAEAVETLAADIVALAKVRTDR